MKKLILFCILNLINIGINAGISVNATFFTTNEGLNNNFVRHIFQDSKGFLWFSTMTGLSRYDGHTFNNFKPSGNENISLVEHHIREVAEDNNHLLWINISPEFYSCYDLRKERFVDFTGCGDYKKKFNRRFITSKGETWLIETYAGCRKVVYDGNSFKSVFYNVANAALTSDNVRALKEDKNNHIWICTAGGLTKVTNNQTKILIRDHSFVNIEFYNNQIYLLTDKFEIFKLEDEKRLIFITRLYNTKSIFPSINSFVFDDKWVIMTPQQGCIFNFKDEKLQKDTPFNISNGQFVTNQKSNFCLFNDEGEIRIINKKTQKVKFLQIHLKDRSTDLWCKYIEDSRGWIWIATFGNGLYLYKPENDELIQYTYKIGSESIISSNSLTNVAEDRSGGIWISTESAGISQLRIINNSVDYVYPENIQLISTSNSIRNFLQLTNGEILVSNREGDVYRYDSGLRTKVEKSHYQSSVYTMYEDTTGLIWYGTRASGIIAGKNHFNKGNKNNELPGEKISLFFEDHKKRVWVGTYNSGLTMVTKKNGSFNFYQLISDSNRIVSIRSLAGDRNNWMWAGTDYGLYVFHPDSLIKHPNSYYQYSYDNNHLLANRVKFVYMDSKNRIWLGTMGGGLSQCFFNGDYADMKFKHYTTSHGLTNNVIQSISEDKSGKLWIATEYGISRFTPETETFENFLFSKIIQGNIFNENSVLKLKDGRLLFGTYHGVAVVNPDKIISPATIDNITITDLKVNGVSQKPNETDSPLKEAISYTKEINLQYNQNSFSIEFATFDYSSANKSKYSYKLEPYDNEWSTPSALNFALYKKLKPGSYTLHIKAANSAGVWSKHVKIIRINIQPPLWATFWAYLIYFILFLLLSYLTYRIAYNFYKLRNRLQVEHQLTDYKLMFFTNISHEFRTPLTLINGVLEKLRNAPDKTDEITELVQTMSKSTNRLMRLINQLLEFRKMQHNKLMLVLEQTEVIAFLNEIFNYFSETAHDKKIEYSFVSSVTELNLFLDKEKLDKILFNLLSNAFKYTPNNGRIEVVVNVNDYENQLVISVFDSGIGIPKEKQKELFSRFMQSSFSNDSVGIGLHLTQELVSVHKGKIKYMDRPEGGSVFLVSLPLSPDIYDKSDFAEKGYIISDSALPDEKQSDEITPKPAMILSDSGLKYKVLLIEDDTDINKFLSKELSIYFEVSSAFDGKSGLSAAQSFDGDLIICDVLMPGMNGFEVTRALKADFETCHIPVILLTAMSSAENQLEGTQAGADAYITKPFSPNLLIARILQLIEQREKLKQKFSSEIDSTTSLISVSEIDKRFVDKLNLIMEKQLENAEFSIDDFAAKLNLGRTSFFRKVKGITGFTPNEYMRIFRLKKAMEFLREGMYNVSEVSFRVGINDPLYFSRCFKKQFGVAPSRLIRGVKGETEK